MSVFSDVGEEFSKASPGGKALMVVALLVVAGLGYYVFLQKQNSSGASGTLVPIGSGGGSTGDTGGGSTGDTGGGSTGGGSTGGTTSGGGSTGGTTSGGGSTGGGSKPPSPKPSSGGNKSGSGTWVTVTKWPSQYGTLWGIAQAQYGNGSLWTKIAKANNIKGTTIFAGQRLWVPK